ncbi:hypothetical protein [Clostridium beijerinckii]|uniref:Uncharacterized protein n=1 Tax=Clostridium beijerinckii TaxID=1520 RepID=A0AAX0AX54_CLOBE|nr:hypothetical protein [Clostridium beijerinckii]NOW04396.1 hypothetical protein [Clostridium beijerinckii]NRT87327.1 hypothetical protein [Clostridium beijerinckii]NRU38979.1 hypothetical protein [Clostridium beijerinckii]NSA97742.1 hypothetical protein [Clostridium beijerinckii]NYC02462.1 hypothetical protein [Clostridium beijerinckii]
MEITGLWSVGSIYYGSFEESYVGFMENNLGFIYYMNIEYDEIELFKWKIDNSKALSINGIEVYSFEDEVLKEANKNNVTNLKNLKVKKYKKTAFNNKEIEVLEFSKPLVLEDMEFGLEEKDVINSHIYKRLIQLIGDKLPEEYKI